MLLSLKFLSLFVKKNPVSWIHSVSGGDGYLEKDPPSPDTPVSLHWEVGTWLPPGRGWLGAWPLQAR